MASYRLADAYREIVHSPRLEGTVMYIPKQSGDTNGLTQDDIHLLNNQELMKLKSKYMNSPTNIRRVWLTHKRVMVEYYAAPIVNGTSVGELSKIRELKSINIDGKKYSVYDIAETIYKYRTAEVSQRTLAKLEDIKLPGRVLQALTHPYTLNNLEEVYIDWASLLTEDAETILAQNNFNLMYILETILGGGNINTNPVNTDIPLRLLVGPDKTQLSSSYKRLKKVVFISNLDEVITTMDNHKVLNESLETFNINQPVMESKSWLDSDITKKYVEFSNSAIWISNTPNPIKSNIYEIKDGKLKTFEIKSAQYAFDDEHLRLKIESYTSKLKDTILKENSYTAKREAEAAQESVQATEGSIEYILDEIIANNTPGKASNIIKIALLEFKRQTGQNEAIVFASMDPVKANKYKKIIRG